MTDSDSRRRAVVERVENEHGDDVDDPEGDDYPATLRGGLDPTERESDGDLTDPRELARLAKSSRHSNTVDRRLAWWA